VVLEFTLLQQAWDVPPDQRPVFRVMRPAPDGLNIYTNILTQVHALVHYLKLLVFPVTLNFDHDFSVARSPLDPRVWLSLGLWAGLGAAAFRVYGRSRLPLFCLLWFLIALSFYVAYPLPDLLVERRLYLPSVGFCLMVAVIAHRLSMLRIPSLSPRAVKALGVIVPLMIVVGYAAGTIRRNAVWHDPLTVWQDSAQKSPAKARIRCNLAAMFLRRNEPAQAAREAREALRLDPDYGDARYNLLSAYANAGLFSQSVAEFATAWRIQPAVAARWYVENYLNLKTNRGPYDDAVSQFAKIVTGASSGDAHVALAVVYLNVYGDRQKGRMYLEQGRRRQPQSFRLNVVDRMLRDLERDRPAAPVTSG
jgi:Tfp pilus assembly protein PilF